ncbi:group 1 truncated hemoglobin [Erythrobacter litoralis]|uniref:group I truncated hemoglobin n=1 Tax=Erythrobacter litoralis TaxID=39960 RepID=UPI002434BBC1|nr:group 1 truncated hemoglobin [Erythrobacter litoralis]MDG6078060.1 group 1 truncated hemoglobin [Erythrobacter litoralis]
MFELALTFLMMQQAPAENTDWDEAFGVEEAVRDPQTGELPVDPYDVDNANAGAKPFSGSSIAADFGGKDGIRQIADRFVDLNISDPRVAAIFAGHDHVRLRRTLYEQFCYILNAGCEYTGRDMATAHQGLGTRKPDLNAIVENLQKAMREADVSFVAQNRFLAKLAPMYGDVVTR